MAFASIHTPYYILHIACYSVQRMLPRLYAVTCVLGRSVRVERYVERHRWSNPFGIVAGRPFVCRRMRPKQPTSNLQHLGRRGSGTSRDDTIERLHQIGVEHNARRLAAQITMHLFHGDNIMRAEEVADPVSGRLARLLASDRHNEAVSLALRCCPRTLHVEYTSILEGWAASQ